MKIRFALLAGLLLMTAVVAFAVINLLTISIPITTAQVGVPYNSTLKGSGGVAPFFFQIVSGSLPPDLTLNSSTGVISGIPTTPGSFSFVARVTDSAGQGSANEVERMRPRSNALAIATTPTVTIVVSAAAGAAGAPIPSWALLAIAMGLALAGMYHLRRARPAA